ncbi:MAG TPA: sugar phosphate isomerase/epimerase, partial [Amaricoccus sp.]|nr:sugar phosphate isomerase/epimerase [Amaricoccus sp.]
VAAMPRNRVNYVQFCDGPKAYDRSDAGLIEVARQARLMPGEGGIDLAGLARAIPGDAVISIEIPNHGLARRLGGAERAALALRTTRAVVEAAAVA